MKVLHVQRGACRVEHRGAGIGVLGTALRSWFAGSRADSTSLRLEEG